MNDKVLQLIFQAVDNASSTIAKVGDSITELGDASVATTAKSGALSDAMVANLAQSGDAIVVASAGVDSLGSKLVAAGKSASELGSALTPMALGAAAAIGVAAKSAIDFNQQMELLHTQAGASQQEVSNLTSKVLALAPAVGFGPTALATALYHIESTGYRGADAMNVLQLASEGAQVGQANLDDTTYALTSTMKSFNVTGVGEATKMMGELNAIVGSGDMKMQDLNNAIQTGILSTAQTFGVDIQSMGAALSYLTDRGEQADVASTRLSMGLTLMAAPSAKAAELLGDIGMQGPAVTASTTAMTEALRTAGLTTVTLADDLKKPDGIQVALQDLETHLQKAGLSADDSAALIAKSFGGGRTDKALMALIENLGGVQQKYDAIGAAAGNFSNDWAAQQDQAKQKMADFQAQVEVLGVKLGNALLPTVTALAAQLGHLADSLSHLSTGQLEAVTDGLLALVALGPVLKVIGTLTTAIGGLLTVLDWLGVALVAVGAAVAEVIAAPIEAAIAIVVGLVAVVVAAGVGIYEAVTHWSNVKKFLSDLWNGIYTDIKTAFGMIKDLFTGGDPTLPADKAGSKYWVDFAKLLSSIRDIAENVGDFFVSFWHQTETTASAAFGAVTRAVDYFFNHFFEIVGYAIGFSVTLPFKLAIAFYSAMYQITAVVVTTFVSVVSAIVGGISRAVTYILSINWLGIFVAIALAVANTMVRVYTSIVGAFNNAINYISNIPWGGIADSIGHVFVDAWNGVKNGAVSAFNYIKDLPWGSFFTGVGRSIGNGVIDLIQGALNGALSGIPGAPHIKIPHFASGVQNFGGGLALVGEQGPEIVSLPQGSNVYSNQASQAMTSGGQSINLTVNVGTFVGNQSAMNQLTTQIHQTLMQIGRSNGVNVPSYGVRPL